MSSHRRCLASSHLVDVPLGQVEEGQHELDLHVGLKGREAVYDTQQPIMAHLGADGVARPEVVCRAKLVVQPLTRVRISTGGHLGCEGRKITASTKSHSSCTAEHKKSFYLAMSKSSA